MEESPPLFLQNSRRATHHHHHGFIFSSFSSILLNPWFVLLATVSLGFLLFYCLPPTLSFLTSILRPYDIKKRWDSLIPLLVLFAIICSFLNKDPNSSNDDLKSNQEATPSTPPQIPKWLDQYTERRRIYSENDPPIVVEETGSSDYKMVSGLRSSSSYPDLRKEEWVSRSDCWQFSDDSDLSNTRQRRSDRQRRRQHRRMGEEEDHGVATADKSMVHQSGDRSSAHAPWPPLDPSRVMKRRVSRTLHKVGKGEGEPDKEKTSQKPAVPTPPPQVLEKEVGRTLEQVWNEIGESDQEKESQQPAAPAPPPPPPPPPCRHGWENKSRKKSGGAKDLASAIAHLYKKKKKNNNKDNSDDALQSPPSSSHPAAPPPPPLPPPPQHSPSVFRNLFKKSSKSKRIHSLTPPPPPPPPPPKKKKITPPVPASTIVCEKEDDLLSGSESPLVPMPPPPPPPPTQDQKLKLGVRMDYGQVSGGLSYCFDAEKAETSTIDGGDESVRLSPSGCCSSPDVDSKADVFIARFHESLRRENLNSNREKKMRTRLGGAATM